MKINYLLFLLAAFGLSMASCNKDNLSEDEEMLLGKWTVTEVTYEGTSVTSVGGETSTVNYTGEGYDMNMTLEFSDNPKEFESSGNYSILLKFNNDGFEYEMPWVNAGFVSNGTWEIIGNKIIFEQNGETQEHNIISLTDNYLEVTANVQQVTATGGGTSTMNISANMKLSK